MKKSRLFNLINQKFDILDSAPELLRAGAVIIEDRILAATLGILDKFNIVDGRIERNDTSNKKLLVLLNKRLKQALSAQPWKSVTSKFLRSFDAIEDANLKILKGVNDLSDAQLRNLDISVEKQLAIETVTDNLLKSNARFNAIGKPIRRLLFRHVTTGITLKQAQDEIRQFIKRGDNLGFVERHVRTLAQDALRSYDGVIAHTAANEFGLDGFRIINPLIANSQISCVEMVTGTGSLGKLRVNGIYRIADIPKIIAIASKRPGWNRNTTKDNYFSNGNHHGCRHSFSPTRIINRGKKRTDSFDENVVEDIDEINE